MVSHRASTSLLGGRCSALCLGFSRSHVATKDDCLRLGQILQNCPSLLTTLASCKELASLVSGHHFLQQCYN